MKNRIFIGAGVLVAVFLAGLIPFYVRAVRLERQLGQAQQAIAYGELRDLSALAYVQASQKNYGLAAETAARFFARVRQAINQTQDENAKKAFEALLTPRDKIIAELAKGDATALSDLESLFLRTREATRR
jgi:hypothetical protein